MRPFPRQRHLCPSSRNGAINSRNLISMARRGHSAAFADFLSHPHEDRGELDEYSTTVLMLSQAWRRFNIARRHRVWVALSRL